MAQQILIILTICIVVQLCLLIVFLLTSSRGKRSSNVLLASFFLLLIINLADGILAYAGLFTKYPSLAHLEDGFVFLFGPVLYLYTQSIIYRDFKLNWKDLWHAAPFLVLTVFYQVYYHMQSAEYQLQIQKSILERSLPVSFYFFAFLIYAHVATYILLSFRHLGYYRHRIRDSFSSLEKINLGWLSFMLSAFAFLLLISFVYTFVPVVGLREWFDPLFISAFIFIFFFAIAIVWQGLRQPQIFSGIEQPAEKAEPKYAGSIGDDERRNLLEISRRLMEEEKIFLDPELTLDKMAAKTPFSQKRLSQLINDSYGQNFFDFVNSFRIREAEKLLRQTAQSRQTILEVMYACGFNSKSSFNTIFRQKTGMTPSDYRKQHKSG
jgi:AraC-like DNA-binding protein